jgi:AcrR family transcriptional regulator
VPRQDHHATEQDQIVTARRLRDLEGLGVPAIATALGVSKRTVYRLLEDKS